LAQTSVSLDAFLKTDAETPLSQLFLDILILQFFTNLRFDF